MQYENKLLKHMAGEYEEAESGYNPHKRLYDEHFARQQKIENKRAEKA